MKTNNLSHLEYVAPKSINRNIELGNLYRIPTNYDEIKENISTMGIITPLIVNSNDNTIVSGNLRHMIALELDLPLIPVFFTKIDGDMQLISLSSNIHRLKSSMLSSFCFSKISSMLDCSAAIMLFRFSWFT